MTTITLPNNGTTITLNGYRCRNLAEGDNLTITYPNARTGRVNSETGVSIHERSDADVADITISVQTYSDDDVQLNAFMNTDPLTVIEGSIKTRYTKNGETLNETFSISAASITDQPEKTVNTQDGSAVMVYTLQSRTTKRAI